jgi:hypothetical protein
MTSVHILLLRVGTRLVLKLPKPKSPVLAVQTMSPRAMKLLTLETRPRLWSRRFRQREYLQIMKAMDASINLMIPMKKRKKSMIYFKGRSCKIFKERSVKTFKGTGNPPQRHTLFVWPVVPHGQRGWRIQGSASTASNTQRSIASKGGTRMIRSPLLTLMGDGTRFVTDVGLIQIQSSLWLPSLLKRRLGRGLSIYRDTTRSQASDVMSLVVAMWSCWITSLSTV